MKGRVAVVTGGIGDIGTAVCQELAKQGARVVAVDYASQKDGEAWQKNQKEAGFSFGFLHVDVTDFESCALMAQAVEKDFGPLDILVNAAGTLSDSSFRKMTPDKWNTVMHTDLDSMFNVTRQFINGMIERKYGRIINISSVSGEKGQFGQTNYASAKAGIYGFTKSLALEVAKHGITVNAVSPGFVESRMVKTIPEDVREKIIAQIPVGRLAKPEEIAWSIACLASERSAFITGANLSVNGGFYM